ncbi:WD40/YVTN/BNR-like repeat-containing protein [Catellatospora aurea]|uniref:WD40/YVTN/BNR-like repeat-containing protein n=1 Tax=Catellatospora aurea TaxID=1337874 RepID=A0ABW2H162_9ACTN
MHDVEQLLRDELHRRSALPAPSGAAVVTAVHGLRRRRRITAVAALGAVAVLATLAGTISALRPTAGSVPPAFPPSSPAAEVSLTESPEVWFADADHGFALARACPADPCQLYLARTEDGGVSWQRHAVPGETMPAEQRSPLLNLRVLSATTVALDSYDGTRRRFTTDGGRTWTSPPMEPQGTVTEIPEGGLAEVRSNTGRPIDIVVLRPDGSSALLATPPLTRPLTSMWTKVVRGDDGSAWVHGGDDTKTWLWVSRDRGRTWRDVPLPGDAARAGTGQRPYIDHGRILYVVEPSPVRRVWRTTDDGAHWADLGKDLPPDPTGDAGLGAVVCFDGTLLVYEPLSGAVYRAMPSEATLGRVGDAPLWDRFGARYLRGAGRKTFEPPFEHSLDGLTWTELKL